MKNIINIIRNIWNSPDKRDIFWRTLGVRESYSQNGEDIILYSNLRKNIGLYVDIGANHPKYFNNFYFLYKKGWTGINVEPNPMLYKQLQKVRNKDINLNVGIGTGDVLDFYTMDAHTLSTFDSDTVKQYELQGHKVRNTLSIPTISLEKLFDQYIGGGKTIDILSVDVEGYDMAVLQSNDWTKYKPTYIILETLEYRQDGTGEKLNHIFDPYLFERGYAKLADTYINTIYKLI